LDRRLAGFELDQEADAHAGSGREFGLSQFKGAACGFHRRGDI